MQKFSCALSREIQPRLTVQEQFAIHLLLLGIYLFPRQRRGTRRRAQTGHQDELGPLEPFGQLWYVTSLLFTGKECACEGEVLPSLPS